MLETVLITLLDMLIKYPKNRVFIGFIAIFYLVSYYVSCLVRLLVSIVLYKNKNVLKVAYLRGFSGFFTLLICLLPSLLINNKKSPVIRRGCSLPVLLSLHNLKVEEVHHFRIFLEFPTA